MGKDTAQDCLNVSRVWEIRKSQVNVNRKLELWEDFEPQLVSPKLRNATLFAVAMKMELWTERGNGSLILILKPGS